MKKLAIAAAVALTVAGCSKDPRPSVENRPQVNRTMKSDKYAAPKKVAAPVEMPVPNEVVKKRWFSGYKIRLFH